MHPHRLTLVTPGGPNPLWPFEWSPFSKQSKTSTSTTSPSDTSPSTTSPCDTTTISPVTKPYTPTEPPSLSSPEKEVAEDKTLYLTFNDGSEPGGEMARFCRYEKDKQGNWVITGNITESAMKRDSRYYRLRIMRFLRWLGWSDGGQTTMEPPVV